MARTLTAAATSETLRAHSRLSTTAGRYTFAIATTAQRSTYDVTDGTDAVSAPLKWAFGAGKVGQSFLFERDGVVREARVSYYEGAGALDVTPGRAADSPRTVTEAMGRVVGGAELRRCFGCHSTASAVRGSFEPDAALPGIACEACHGPGLRHAAAMRERRIVEGQGAILNPARLEPADSVDFCGACHATFCLDADFGAGDDRVPVRGLREHAGLRSATRRCSAEHTGAEEPAAQARRTDHGFDL